MTQLMLFDSSPVSTSPPAPSPSAPGPQPVRPPVRGRLNQIASPRKRPDAGTDGVHRMGDLARLVLLRYQLVARDAKKPQRRQEMAPC